ncbi:MAG: PmoA family protein [Planctomycetales bacterium]|nr:PmoA family protein [Planctomycetales bacterium]
MNRMVNLHTRMRRLIVAVATWSLSASLFAPLLFAQFRDAGFDKDALPQVPEGFRVTLFASEPLVRQPCSMAFDARGRLFVGMGPQYRNPRPETPGDRVVIVLDSDGDGRADRTHDFASGLNAIQGLAWHGRDLWIANAPDLTIARDLDGDDVADEYVKVYTDLGNLEHGLHGLNWAPDGKLYMSKGNSKGLTEPGRVAPRPFRELWGVVAPPGTPDMPPPVTYDKASYRRAYHDPADDWGLGGGILRCEDGGANLEIIARGFRNPWDITLDSGFNWLGTDNDQTEGDRVFMPFFGAHFGWNHPWSAQWADAPSGPAAPVSGPLFEGSGTGLIYHDFPAFPESHRGVFFVNDWLSKTTYLWRPRWDGALMRPAGPAESPWTPFVVGGRALYRPTDIEVGPDGALWVLGWSSGYGAEWNDAGELTNEGRVYRIARVQELNVDWRGHTAPPREQSVAQLVAALGSPLPVWRIDAQDELARRGDEVRDLLWERLVSQGESTRSQLNETWLAWTLGRMAPEDQELTSRFVSLAEGQLPKVSPDQPRSSKDRPISLNLRLQALRVVAQRCLASASSRPLFRETVARALSDPAPRLRLAAVEAIGQAADDGCVPMLLQRAAVESDRTVFYAAWRTLAGLASPAALQERLSDANANVRRAALLALLEHGRLAVEEVRQVEQNSTAAKMPSVALVARQWLEKAALGGEPRIVKGPSLLRPDSALDDTDMSSVSVVASLRTRSRHRYQVAPAGLRVGALPYTDRTYRVTKAPPELAGADLIQTANADDGSSGEAWLSLQLRLPARVYVGVDTRMPASPRWVRQRFRESGLAIETSDCTLALHQADVAEGLLELGGNTDDGEAGGKSNYVVIVELAPLSEQQAPPSIAAAQAALNTADVARGELLFRRRAGAGCQRCHRLDAGSRSASFGPSLADIGRRSNAKHILQSILEPSAVITEGFNRQVVATDDGTVFAGVLLEESGLALTLGLATGDRVTLDKSTIARRRSDRVSAMPEVAQWLTAQHAADLTAFLLQQQAVLPPAAAPVEADAPPGEFSAKRLDDRLEIYFGDAHLADYVFRDDKILRSYFANVRGLRGTPVTRRHPPEEGKDAVDHDTMHPGVWLGFGDISGVDFWRNKGRIVHEKFLESPRVDERGQLQFATQSQLQTPAGEPLGSLRQQFRIAKTRGGDWRLEWQSTFRSEDREIVFGDQEEMGFGARVATPLTETNGGQLRSSTGNVTAAKTWGQLADWCDYSGKTSGSAGARSAGVTLMASPVNFRPSWWHNRNYGVFVANPFGRQAMRQGARSAHAVPRGVDFTLHFAACFHDSENYDPAVAYRETFPAKDRPAGASPSSR